MFANVLLVDEINRAMPKTQSALLEAMAERQATVDGVTHPLPDPFLLLATENPIEQEGTFPLPEAQLDRFSLKIALGYPTIDQEVEIVRGQRSEHPLAKLRPVVDLDEVPALEHALEHVYTDELLLRWIVELVAVTRTLESVALGASVRASLALERTRGPGRSSTGATTSSPEDVELLFLPVLGHRIVFTPTFLAEARRLGRDEALDDVPPPVPRARAAAAARRGSRAARSGRLLGREPVRRRSRHARATRRRQPIEPVPLLPRARMIGSMLGAYTSIRRGDGSDVAGSRPYRPGRPLADDRLEGLGARSRPSAATTSSSSASGTRTRCRAS